MKLFFISLFMIASGLLIEPSIGFVSDSDLFPFGGSEDQRFFFGDDDVRQHNFQAPFTFNFFNHTYDNVFISGNGQVSFGQGVREYTPSCLPSSVPMIMTYWADADNRKDTETCRLLYRETTNRTHLKKAGRDIFLAFPELKGIALSWMFVITWKDLPFFTSSSGCDGASKRNTFQLVLTTDGVHSFALMYYNKIEWTTGSASDGNCQGLEGKPAKAGFDYGNGRTWYTIPNSCTQSILNITQTSNINQPGKWVFRIDSNLKTAECQEFSRVDQKLRLTPNAVSFMGNVPLRLEGPCIPQNASVSCTYHDFVNLTTPAIKIEVSGAVIRSVEENNIAKSFAVCPIPFFQRLGRTLVELNITRQNETGNDTISEVYSGYIFVLDDRIVGEHLKFRFINQSSENYENAEIFVKVEWDPTFLETEINYLNQMEEGKTPEGPRRRKRSTSEERVDLFLESYDGQRFREFGVLEGGIQNTGSYEGTIDKQLLEEFINLQHPEMFMVSMSRAKENADKDGLSFGKLTAELGEAYFNYVNATSPPITTLIANSYCKLWSYFSDPPPTDTLHCPPTAQIAADDNDFEPDAAGPWMSKLHPGGKSAVRQRIPSDSGAGSQCVYDKDGNLMSGPFGGGTLDRYSPTQFPVYHFFWDVAPYVACCRLSGRLHADKNCILKYYELRPSDDGTEYVRKRVARAVGDPHVTTFDGLVYTFNGVGEFWMVKYVDTGRASPVSFKMQARMEQYISPSTGQPMSASVFTCVVMEELRNGEKVNIQVSYSDEKISILLDGDTIDIMDVSHEFSLRHKSSSITVHSPDTVTVTFSSSFSFKFSTIGVNEVALNIIGSAKDSSAFNGIVDGLMGNLDGIKDNDLRRPDGVTLPPSPTLSTPQQIHYDFGLKWMVPENESLFTYLPGKSYADYARPDFQPEFIMNVDTRMLPKEIVGTCGDNRECLFDYSTTGSQAFANETKMSTDRFKHVQEIFSNPIPMCATTTLPKIQNGISLVTTLLVGGVATFECNEGYNHSRSTINRPVECVCTQGPDKLEPEWNCNFESGNPNSLICLNVAREEESPEVPTCEEPKQPTNGLVIGTNYTLGSTIELRCINSSYEIYWGNCNFHGDLGLCKDLCKVTYSCVEQNVTLEDGSVETRAVWEGYPGDINRVTCFNYILGKIATALRGTGLLVKLTMALATGKNKIALGC